MDLGLHHLRIVVVVAEAGAISRAATRLKVAQSGLTAQLRRIEQGFGAPLFDRSRDGVVPTELGRHVILRAEELLRGFADLMATAKLLVPDEQEHSELRLGGGDNPWVPVIATEVRRLLPDRDQITYIEATPATVVDMLRDGKLDVAVLTDYPDVPPAGHEEFDGRLLGVEPLVIGLGAVHRFAGRDEVDLAELADEDWVAPPDAASGLRLSLRLACERAGFSPRFRHFGADRATAEALVASSHAVTVLHRTAAQRKDVRLVRLADEPLWSRTTVVWPAESPMASISDAFHPRRL
ncbi:LysR family transcriptional regulator [Amycolatopsis jejuensis]|uniref:LysR family transcriptional regulator n=1 Tax=Amycolatopsis jejuensis TaxID=330084 RepID=UPI00068E7FD5|nr:LysR family transcriptional regulator [Amycolatopsis jejuensis]